MKIMKAIFSLFILSSITSTCMSQIAAFNYVPFEIENIEVDWVHVSQDSTIANLQIPNSTATFDGYSHLWPFYHYNRKWLIDDGYIYNIHRTRYDNDLSGALIEKIDLNSGKPIWSITFDQRTQERREFVCKASIKDDRLILYNLLIMSEDPEPINWPIVWLGWAEGYLKIREYDLNSGMLLHETFPDTTSDLHLISSYNFDETILNVNEDYITVYYHDWTRNGGPYTTIDTIDYSGVAINPSDTLFSLLGAQDWANAWQTENHKMYFDEESDKFYWIDVFTPQPNLTDSTTLINLNVLDNGVISTIDIDIPDKDNVMTWSILQVKSGEILLKLFYPDDTTAYVLLEETGQMIWKVDLARNDMRFIQIDSLRNFLLLRKGNTAEGKSKVDVLKYENGSLFKKGEFVLKNKDYYMALFYEIYPLPNDKYLVALEYREDIPSYSDQGSFRALFKVDGKQIGLTVGTEEGVLSHPEFKFFPNPCHSNLTVYSELPDGRLDLLTIDGKLVLNHICHEGTNTFDLSNFNSGLYHLKMTYEGFSITRVLYKE